MNQDRPRHDSEQISPTQAEIDAGADVMAEIVDDLIDKALRPDGQER